MACTARCQHCHVTFSMKVGHRCDPLTEALRHEKMIEVCREPARDTSDEQAWLDDAAIAVREHLLGETTVANVDTVRDGRWWVASICPAGGSVVQVWSLDGSEALLLAAARYYAREAR